MLLVARLVTVKKRTILGVVVAWLAVEITAIGGNGIVTVWSEVSLQ